MRSFQFVALVAASSVALSGCGALRALSGFNAALVPDLKPVDVQIHTDIGCSDLAAQVMAASAATPLTGNQVLAIVQFCERRDATRMLQLDPAGARKALQQMIAKPVVPLSAGAIIPPS